MILDKETGYNINGQLKPLFSEGLKNSFQNKFTQAVEPAVLGSGEVSAILKLSDGSITSKDYVAGVSGWKLNADGTSDIN